MTVANKREDVWKLVNKQGDNECWLWKGRTNSKGYGEFDVQGKSWKAHRLVFEVHNHVVLPSTKEVAHSCSNPVCCNPAHLFLASHAENMVNKRCSLTQLEIDYIRASTENQYVLASRFGCSSSTISRVKRFSRVPKDVTKLR
jgi:HNH endonuclease